eukprot:TRINITY_DN51447_c0_g1_i1.p1 TRINITY_DN51447_c0_g1~~TRINITY_DN51447_c0_g1_i1.p1  ORF type:complete len:659 (+),score=94.91 TRINITY_DN51447_c0_g1_i1:43-2019(+)
MRTLIRRFFIEVVTTAFSEWLPASVQAWRSWRARTFDTSGFWLFGDVRRMPPARALLPRRRGGRRDDTGDISAQLPMKPVSLPTGALAGVRGAAALAARLANCSTVSMCAFHWYFLSLLFGPRGSFEDGLHEHAWAAQFGNFSWRLRLLRCRELQTIAKFRFHLQRDDLEGSVPGDADASLLVYMDRAKVFEEPHVQPFVRHLKCYAERRGMGFLLADSRGGFRVDRGEWDHRSAVTTAELPPQVLADFGDHVVTTREGVRPSQHKYLQGLVAAFLAGEAGRAVELAARRVAERPLESLPVEEQLVVTTGHPYRSGKVAAIAERLSSLPSGGLLVQLEPDVTIRPDAGEVSLVDLLMLGAGRRAHVFIRDTWPGTECVNAGFVAVRNSEVARLFLELWQEKLHWSSLYDQIALGETILEVIGIEVEKLSGGSRGYGSECLPMVFPIATGHTPRQVYCDCWHDTLAALIGPYRQRQSRVVAFVDPERVDVNFVPNDLFPNHGFDLQKMRLFPQGTQVVMNPLFVHWAGTGTHRLWLMEEYLRRRFNLSMVGCPILPGLSSRRAFGEATDPSNPRWIGTAARQVRCCEKVRDYGSADLAGHPLAAWLDWWGCTAWPAVTVSHCALLGIGDIGPNALHLFDLLGNSRSRDAGGSNSAALRD